MFANSFHKRPNAVSLERALENAQEQESDSSHEEIHERLFLVEKILDKKKFEGMYKYKVKWEGFSNNECTWEPYDNLTNVSALIEDFEKKRIEKQGSKKSSKKASAIKDLGERKIDRGIQNKTFERLKQLETDFGNCTDLVEVVDSDDTSQKVVPPRKGHFIKGDKAKCIKNLMKKDNKIIFKIEWEQGKNGERIMDSKMDSDEVRKYDKDLIIDYYQSHLRVAKVGSQTLSETNKIQTVEDDNISECESLESDMSKESKYSGNFGKRLSDWLIKKGERIREYSFKKSKESRPPMKTIKVSSREANKSKRMLHVEDKQPSEEDSVNPIL